MNKIKMNNTETTIRPEIFEGFKNKIKSQVFKLLPLREENGEWRKHLDATLIELYGADEIFLTINFCRLVSKLSILRYLEYEYYRKTIFECLNLIDVLDDRENGGE